MKKGDKLVCKNNIINDIENPLILEREYLLLELNIDNNNNALYKIYDSANNKVYYINTTGEQDLISHFFYSLADYRDIKLNRLGI